MTAPFDWTELIHDLLTVEVTFGAPAATDVLRTRIEAAFVPVETYHRDTGIRDVVAIEATARAEAAEAEVQRLEYSTTHTCWNECPRLACAQRREIEALTAQIARARQEGWNAAIEAAAERLRVSYLYTAADTKLAFRSARDIIRTLAMPDLVRDTLADSDGDDGA